MRVLIALHNLASSMQIAQLICKTRRTLCARSSFRYGNSSHALCAQALKQVACKNCQPSDLKRNRGRANSVHSHVEAPSQRATPQDGAWLSRNIRRGGKAGRSGAPPFQDEEIANRPKKPAGRWEKKALAAGLFSL